MSEKKHAADMTMACIEMEAIAEADEAYRDSEGEHQSTLEAMLKRLGLDASEEATQGWKVGSGSGWTSHEKTWAANDAHAHISHWNEDSTLKLEMEIGGECWIDQEECSSVEDAMRRASFEAKEGDR